MLENLLPVVIEGTGGGDTYDETGTGTARLSAGGTYSVETFTRSPPKWVPDRRVVKAGVGEMRPEATGQLDRQLLLLMRQLFEEDDLVVLDLL